MSHLRPEVDRLGHRSVDGSGHVTEARLQGQRAVDPHPVDERQARPGAFYYVAVAVGADGRHESGGGGVEVVNGRGAQEGKHLVQGLAAGPGGSEAERRADGQRGEDEVGAAGDGREPHALRHMEAGVDLC